MLSPFNAFFVICDSFIHYCDTTAEDCAPCSNICPRYQTHCKDLCPNYHKNLVKKATTLEPVTEETSAWPHVNVDGNGKVNGNGTDNSSTDSSPQPYIYIIIAGIVLLVLIIAVLVRYLIRKRRHRRRQPHTRANNARELVSEQLLTTS